MASYNNRPALYILSNPEWGPRKKFGSSMHIPYRKFHYLTGSAYPHTYTHVLFLDLDALKREGRDLYTLDSLYFKEWLKVKSRDAIHCKYGGGTEFYECDDLYALVREFLSSCKLHIVEELTSDPFLTYPESEEVYTSFFHEEMTRTQICLDERKKRKTLAPINKEHFKRIFLPPTCDFRTNQNELWDLWADMLTTHSQITGIVQWPTGCGKTYGMLMMFLLSALHTQRTTPSKVFRAMLIAPKNDILDTLMPHIRKLSEFKIDVYEGHNANFKTLALPRDKPFLLTMTHAALADPEVMRSLPEMTHVHYDEVHRITGDTVFKHLKERLPEWGTSYITGTSATPETSNREQRKKIAELFGEPLKILHCCSIDDAITNGWIAKPRFNIVTLSEEQIETSEKAINATLASVANLIAHRQATTSVIPKGIVYFNTLQEVNDAYAMARMLYPHWKCYAATDAIGNDHKFVKKVPKAPTILFACDKYREGSDIPGLEFTAILMGHTIAAYILLQIIGRALRADYTGKIGDCLIIRPSFKDDGDMSALEHILLDLEVLITSKAGTTFAKKDIEPFVRKYFGTFTIEGRMIDINETIERIQYLYVRRAFKGDRQPTLDLLQTLNHDLGLRTRADYFNSRERHPCFIESPEVTFRSQWYSWYNFLGVDVSSWPATKDAWKAACVANGMTTWTSYTEKLRPEMPLPPNPSEMYPTFTNWDDEFPTLSDW